MAAQTPYLADQGCRRTWAPRRYGTILGTAGLLARWVGSAVSAPHGVDNNNMCGAIDEVSVLYSLIPPVLGATIRAWALCRDRRAPKSSRFWVIKWLWVVFACSCKNIFLVHPSVFTFINYYFPSVSECPWHSPHPWHQIYGVNGNSSSYDGSAAKHHHITQYHDNFGASSAKTPGYASSTWISMCLRKTVGCCILCSYITVITY